MNETIIMWSWLGSCILVMVIGFYFMFKKVIRMLKINLNNEGEIESMSGICNVKDIRKKGLIKACLEDEQ